MTTLERLEKVEAELKALTTLLGAVAQSKQETSGVKDSVTQLQEGFGQIVKHMNSRFEQLFNFCQALAQREMSAEQSATSLGKTIHALVSELESQKLINSDNVMTRIRRMDEESEKARISQMVQLKVIQESEEVKNESIFVVSQKHVSKEGKEEVVAEFRVIEMPSQLTNEQVKSLFLGKKVGETVEETLKDGEGQVEGTLLSKVEQVYELTQKAEVGGEVAGQEAASEVTTEQPAQ